MGNVPDTVKHCLSYEQLVQDYPWLRRWLLEEKVGVAFLAAAYLVHMHCHMTSLWQRLQQPSTDAAWLAAYATVKQMHITLDS